MHHDDAGGNEWRFPRIEGGRGVLVGADHECDDHLDVEGYDPYAAPDRLPWSWFAELENDREQGFAYWWDGSAWARIYYPEFIGDDGSGLLLSRLATAEDALRRFPFAPVEPRKTGRTGETVRAVAPRRSSGS